MYGRARRRRGAVSGWTGFVGPGTTSPRRRPLARAPQARRRPPATAPHVGATCAPLVRTKSGLVRVGTSTPIRRPRLHSPAAVPPGRWRDGHVGGGLRGWPHRTGCLRCPHLPGRLHRRLMYVRVERICCLDKRRVAQGAGVRDALRRAARWIPAFGRCATALWGEGWGADGAGWGGRGATRPGPLPGRRRLGGPGCAGRAGPPGTWRCAAGARRGCWRGSSAMVGSWSLG